MLDQPTGLMARVSDIVAATAAQHGIHRAIGPDDALVDRGLTSMAMVDLMLAVESAFDLTIPQRELTPTNFRSVADLASLLRRLGVMDSAGRPV